MMLTGLLIADISGHASPAAPPVTLIGFTGMIRDPTRTTVSGKIARSFDGGQVTEIPFFAQCDIAVGLSAAGLFPETRSHRRLHLPYQGVCLIRFTMGL
jgi:hypothetical protein